MQQNLTLDLAHREFLQANQAILQAGFKIEEYLKIVLKTIGSSRQLNEDAIERIFHLLADDVVIRLAKAKMAKDDSKLYSRLLAKQSEGKISDKEREKLRLLSEEYERGTLRKAYAIAEAARRGLMPHLHS